MATSSPSNSESGPRKRVATSPSVEQPAQIEAPFSAPIVETVSAEELRRQEVDEAWRLSSDGQG